MKTITEKEAKEIFEQVESVIVDNQLLWNEETKLKLCSITLPSEHVEYNIAVITTADNVVFSSSSLWGSNENGRLFVINGKSADEIIEDMKRDIAIK